MATYCLLAILVLGLFGMLEGSCLSNCKNANAESVARVVYGEARGESERGQLAVAYTIENRVKHIGYPKSIANVLAQKDSNGNLAYNTLDNAAHTALWHAAKKKNDISYQNAINAAKNALCACATDPTSGAVDFCAKDPCSATSSNKYYKATNKIHIGNHWFVCREKV